jgi:ornithine cyclodeaminase
MILILSRSDVERLLPVRDCIPVMEEALSALARGECHQPLRTIVRPPQAAGLLGLMPAYASGSLGHYYGLKAVSVFPGNVARGKDAHQGSVLLYSGETGELLAVMDGSAVTAIRTAAVTAVATRKLAREDARVLALIGAGHQALPHLEALASVRRFEEVRLAARRVESARRFVETVAPRFDFRLVAADTVESAVTGADVITALTNSRQPVLMGRWIGAGAHVNLVGASQPDAREADTDAMSRSTVFVDRRESTLNESGDYLAAAREGLIGPRDLIELGDVLTGKHPGRRSGDEITLFKSLGLAVEDLAAAAFLLRRAGEKGAGASVPF